MCLFFGGGGGVVFFVCVFFNKKKRSGQILGKGFYFILNDCHREMYEGRLWHHKLGCL